MRIIFSILLFFSLSFADVTKNEAYLKGEELYKSKVCYSCHGHKLEGLTKFPRLANRAKGFLAFKLRNYRAGKADNQAEEMMITYSIDLSDEDIRGGQGYAYTAGLNWYWTAYSKVQTNLIYGKVRNGGQGAPGVANVPLAAGVDGAFTILGMRYMIDY